MEEYLEAKVYPNPTKNFLNIESPKIINRIVIHDINGRVLYSTDVDSEKINIDVQSFAPGIYLVEIVSENFINYKKIFVW